VGIVPNANPAVAKLPKQDLEIVVFRCLCLPLGGSARSVTGAGGGIGGRGGLLPFVRKREKQLAILSARHACGHFTTGDCKSPILG
jgi:hypothetical protein